LSSHFSNSSPGVEYFSRDGCLGIVDDFARIGQFAYDGLLVMLVPILSIVATFAWLQPVECHHGSKDTARECVVTIHPKQRSMLAD
jgi:hypothetical protein